MLQLGLDAHDIFLDLFDEGQMILQRIEARIGRRLMACTQQMGHGRNQGRIDPVVFGALQMHHGKRLHLQRLQCDDCKPRRLQMPGCAALIAASCLNADLADLGAGQTGRETGPALGGVSDRESARLAMDGHIELVF